MILSLFSLLLSFLPIFFDRSYYVDIYISTTSLDRLILQVDPPDVFFRLQGHDFSSPSDENYTHSFSIKIEDDEDDDDEDDNEDDDDVEIVRPHCWETTTEMIHRDDNLLMFSPKETFCSLPNLEKENQTKEEEEERRNEMYAIFFLFLFFSFFSRVIFFFFLSQRTNEENPCG